MKEHQNWEDDGGNKHNQGTDTDVQHQVCIRSRLDVICPVYQCAIEPMVLESGNE